MSNPPQRLGRLRASWRILLKEISAFGVVGAVNFALDLAVYQLLYVTFHQGALVSKVVSTAVTATTAYFMHRNWSFSHRARTGLRREFGLFVLLSALSLVLGLLLIGFVRYGLGRTDVLSLQVANVVSIGLGAIFRFWSYKRWVFPAKSPGHGDDAGSAPEDRGKGDDDNAFNALNGLPTSPLPIGEHR